MILSNVHAQRVKQTLLDEAKASDTYEEAYAILDSALTSQPLGGDGPYNKALITGYKGIVALMEGESSKALFFFQTCETLAIGAGDSTLAQKSRGNKALALQLTGNYEEASVIHQRNLIRERNEKDSLSMRASLTNLGSVYLSMSRFNEATSAFAESMRIDSTLKHKDYPLSVSNLLGQYVIAKNYAAAIDLAPRAIALAKKEGNKKSLGTALQAYGVANQMIGSYKIAESYLNQAKKYVAEANDKQFTASLYTAFFDLYKETNRPELALPAADSAIANSYEGDYVLRIGSKAEYMMKQKIYSPEVAEIVSEMISWTKSTPSALSMAYSRQIAMTYASGMGDVKLARRTADTLVGILDTSEFYYWTADLAVNLAEVYRAAGEFTLSNVFLDSAYSILKRDSEARLEGTGAVGALEVERRDAEIARQRLATNISQARARRNQYISIALVVLALLGIGYAYQQLRAKRNERSQRHQIEEKNAELTRVNALLDIASKDAYHRVRNDFQSLGNYLNLMATHAAPGAEAAAIIAAREQVAVMGDINSLIEQQQVKDKLTLGELLDAYFDIARQAYLERGLDIEIAGRVRPDTRLPARQFKWLAMMLNECITNASKHGDFSAPNQGAIRISIDQQPQAKGEIQLRVSNPVIASPSNDAPAAAAVDTRRSIGQEVLVSISQQFGWTYYSVTTPHEYITTITIGL